VVAATHTVWLLPSYHTVCTASILPCGSFAIMLCIAPCTLPVWCCVCLLSADRTYAAPDRLAHCRSSALGHSAANKSYEASSEGSDGMSADDVESMIAMAQGFMELYGVVAAMFNVLESGVGLSTESASRIGAISTARRAISRGVPTTGADDMRASFVAVTASIAGHMAELNPMQREMASLGALPGAPDVMVCAGTGTGKSLALLLWMLARKCSSTLCRAAETGVSFVIVAVPYRALQTQWMQLFSRVMNQFDVINLHAEMNAVGGAEAVATVGQLPDALSKRNPADPRVVICLMSCNNLSVAAAVLREMSGRIDAVVIDEADAVIESFRSESFRGLVGIGDVGCPVIAVSATLEPVVGAVRAFLGTNAVDRVCKLLTYRCRYVS
jgi:hypothetical protein